MIFVNLVLLPLQAFWDWSWEELALYDLAGMIEYIYQMAGSKVFIVGHSQVVAFPCAFKSQACVF